MFDINGKDNSTYNIENIELIKKASPKVGEFIEKEYYRPKNNVELIASENYCSEARRICLRRMEKSLRYGLSCECTASQRISG